MAKSSRRSRQTIETLTHTGATRKNIPTAEYQAVVDESVNSRRDMSYARRNHDLDPQLVWRGKDEQNWSDLVVSVPPLFIQEKVHPKVLIDDLLRRSRESAPSEPEQIDLFSDFNGVPDEGAKTEFYEHDANWTNRMILGDGLQVMASLAEREGLRGQVQCIYVDPPYGIKFNSNFQWSTTTRDVKDGNLEHITREPEQVKAFRDTWRDGVHSYLTYLRDRLSVAHTLLKDSGSVFVQIGEENLHLVRSLLDECFGADNFLAQISFVKAGALGARGLPRRLDYLLWYAKDAEVAKFRRYLIPKSLDDVGQYTQIVQPDFSLRPLSKAEKADHSLIDESRLSRLVSFTKPGPGARYPLHFEGETFEPGRRWWGFPEASAMQLVKAGRLRRQGKGVASLRYWTDFAVEELSNLWTDTASGSGMDKVYVVQTNVEVVKRCLLMATDPGDLVVDPTCGSGTTAYVAEQWGRRWITVDTSRVALALARARIMGARYPYYTLADSPEGQVKEAEISRNEPSTAPTFGDLRHGFVCQRVPRITLKAISTNAEVSVIWQKFEGELEPLRQQLNEALSTAWEAWEVPADPVLEGPEKWPSAAVELHKRLRDAMILRQREIDASIAARAEFETLHHLPFENKGTVRVAGPFTVESVSPHRVLGVDEDGELVDSNGTTGGDDTETGFVEMVLENLKTAGVEQARKGDGIEFTSVTPWPGTFVCAEGVYAEGADSGAERRAAIFIGPEFGTVSRPDLVSAAREAAESDFDVLVACAFNYEAHVADLEKLGKIPVLKARMNADLHMADDLKNTGKGNLFVIFGEPDIEVIAGDDTSKIQVKVHGVDVFHPSTGEVRSDDADDIACWFVDTDYNEESFFVRHAYFLGASDPYKALKTTLRNEINEDAWASLHSDISQPFDKPQSGRIAVKVINHLGDEVMKVLRVA